MEFKDYYKILGVDRGADQKEIQRAYRKLARKYHPDVNSSPDAEGTFKEIGEAYEVLKDPEKRAKYDRFGQGWDQQGGPPPGWQQQVQFDFGGRGGEGFGFDSGSSGFSSFFEMLFGQQGGGFEGFRPGGGRRQASRVQRGPDLESRLTLSLEEAAAGGERSLTLQDPASGSPCSFRVRIPSGVRPGQKIRLAGKGAPGRGGGPAGDLFLTVEVPPHPRLRLEGSDLYTTLDVAPWQAALGSEVKVQTLDGTVTTKVPPGSSSGRKIRLRGRGFPMPRGGSGDLYAVIRIVVPDDLSPSERELYEKLRLLG